MAQYIDKSATIAKIKEIYNEDYKFLPSDIVESVRDFKDDLLTALDTFEAKELKEEHVSEELEEAAQEYVTKEGYLVGLHYNSMVRSFKAGAEWADKHSIESKEVDLNEEIEKCLKKHSMLAVGKKDFADIAKHFFELGMTVGNKAQKGE